MNIRQATRSDETALRALENRTPLNIGDQPLFVHHDDFFEMHDLQERTVVMLAEDGGQIAGVCAGALNSAPLAGQERLLLYMHHERIDPEHQRKGIGGALTSAISEYWKENAPGHIDSSYWYIGAGNMQSRSFAERGGNRPWSIPLSICPIASSVDVVHGPLHPIGAGPTYDIVRLINRTHEGEYLFRPYEHVDFGRRLSLSPNYGWGDIYGHFEGGRLVATAGVLKDWVGDYGYEAGAEKAMVALLARLALVRRGLSILLDERSPLYSAMAPAPAQRFPLLFYAPRIEEPPAPSLLYVDPVYF
jgi:GNAT superfamily N-acetyltransferase